MAIWVDPPAWPAHGRLWSHLVSDASYDELHAFAARNGLPRRGFDRDHYDVPDEALAALVAAGATLVSSRELVGRLQASGLRRRKGTAMGRRAAGTPLLRPPRLREGDLVAVTAPAGPIRPERLAKGVDVLRRWGLRVRVMPHVLDTDERLDFLAGSDDVRAGDFEAAWLDDEVAAVIAGRGGYGAQRIVDLVDWRRLAAARPKILAGFSDVTALHQAAASRLGIVTLHSHVATSLGDAPPESVEWMRTMLFEPAALDLFAGTPVVASMPGSASGVLVGGNLSLVVAEIGSGFSRSGKGGIVLLEDVTEEPYRIDRLLTQLLRSGWFDGVRGLVLGTFVECGEPAALDAVLHDRLDPLGVPTVFGFDAGHSSSARCVPLGVRATLDVPTDGTPARLVLDQPPFT